MASDFIPGGGPGGPQGGQRRDEDPNERIAQLRSQVEELMRERVAPAMGDAAARAGEAAQQAKDFAEAQVDTVEKTIRERPLTALAIAVGVGYFFGRSTR
jgi:ElaB/YqjD/DUF883 family membrane-anchored ribosome-binding protein